MAVGKNKRMSKGKKGGKKKAYVIRDAMRCDATTRRRQWGRSRVKDRGSRAWRGAATGRMEDDGVDVIARSTRVDAKRCDGWNGIVLRLNPRRARRYHDDAVRRGGDANERWMRRFWGFSCARDGRMMTDEPRFLSFLYPRAVSIRSRRRIGMKSRRRACSPCATSARRS